MSIKKTQPVLTARDLSFMYAIQQIYNKMSSCLPTRQPRNQAKLMAKAMFGWSFCYDYSV